MKWIVLVLMSLATFNAIGAELTNESEAGITVASGNTDSKNYNIKQSNAYKFSLNTLKFEGRFLNTFSDNEESARYIQGSLRYERDLNEKFSIYVSQGFESDKFAGYYLRHLSDIGGKYNIVKVEMFYWLAEVGYRYTNEKLENGTHDYKNSVRVYTETEKKWNPNVATKYYLEYVPNLEEGKDYQINTELSVSAMLTSIFSIKSAYLVRYDHLPATGSKTTDRLLTTALVAKF